MSKPNESKMQMPKGVFATVVIVSLVIGSLAGGVSGFVTGTIYSGSWAKWLSDPLGVIIRPGHQPDSSTAALGQPAPAGIDTEEATTQAVSRVTPAVVSIIVSKELQPYNSDSLSFPFDQFFSFPFDQFFQTTPVPQPEQNQAEPEKQKVGGGTGFIISADGLILTNKHVVDDIAADYSVVLSDGTSYEAEVVARDPLNDFAFLRIEAQDLPTVDLGDSDQIQIGQTVIAIGFSLGEYSNTVTKGIISGIGRDIVAGSASGSEKLEGVIQTDAAINPGNSGGPLINLAGEVIGINTAINSQGQLVGFAIPINSAKSVIASVKENGRIVRAYLGVRYLPLNSQIQAKNNLAYDYGALLVRGDTPAELAVVPGSPADQAGLEENDIILEVEGGKLDQAHSLAKEVAKYQPGDVINLKVSHDGQEKTIPVELREFQE